MSLSGIMSLSCLPPNRPKQSQIRNKDVSSMSIQLLNKNHSAGMGCVLTPVYQWQGAVLISPIAAGVVRRVEVDHEVRFLPAVFLQSAAELFEAPHDLQHQPSATYLSI